MVVSRSHIKNCQRFHYKQCHAKDLTSSEFQTSGARRNEAVCIFISFSRQEGEQSSLVLPFFHGGEKTYVMFQVWIITSTLRFSEHFVSNFRDCGDM